MIQDYEQKICPSTVCHIHHSQSSYLVLRTIRPSAKINSLFHEIHMIQFLSPLVLLIINGSSVMEQRRSIYLKHFFLSCFNFFPFFLDSQPSSVLPATEVLACMQKVEAKNIKQGHGHHALWAFLPGCRICP